MSFFKKNMKFKLQNHLEIKAIIYYIFFIFIFFPYFSLLGMSTDMQPNALAISIFIFLKYRVKFTNEHLLIGFVFLISIVVFFFSEISFNSVRSVFNYTSLFFISYTVFKILKNELINLNLFLKISVLIWFFAGLIQSLFGKNLFTFMVASARTTPSRGVTGLANEPTFYGIVFIFFILVFLHSSFKNKNFYIFLCIFGIIFFSKSSMAVLFLLLLLFLFIILNLSFKYIFFALLLFLSLFFLINFYIPDSRLTTILKLFFENPRNLVLIDASVNDRFFHVFFSFKGSIQNFFLPNGYSFWNDFISSQINLYKEYIIIKWFSVGGRIMSGYGASFFELGFVTLIFPLIFFKMFYVLYKNKLKSLVLYFLFINLIMLSAIPIGFSLFAFYIGYLRYLVWKNKKMINE
jgi:hypothetical protein